VLLQGQAPNTQALGAVLRFAWSGGSNAVPVQMAQVTAGGRYLSGDAPGKTFAAPAAGSGRLEVRWPSGRVTVQEGVSSGGPTLRIQEPASPSTAPTPSTPTPVPEPTRLGKSEIPKFATRWRFEARPLAEGSPASVGSASAETFAQQPSLPRRWRRVGPALAVDRGEVSQRGLWVGGSGAHGLQYRLPAGEAPVREGGPASAEVSLASGVGGVLAVTLSGKISGSSASGFASGSTGRVDWVSWPQETLRWLRFLANRLGCPPRSFSVVLRCRGNFLARPPVNGFAAWATDTVRSWRPRWAWCRARGLLTGRRVLRASWCACPTGGLPGCSVVAETPGRR
jgi:hypothetical protein